MSLTSHCARPDGEAAGVGSCDLGSNVRGYLKRDAHCTTDGDRSYHLEISGKDLTVYGSTVRSLVRLIEPSGCKDACVVR